MADQSIQVTWVNQASFMESVKRARAAVGDLTPAMSLIARDWFQSQASVFQQAPGPYPDLAKSTKTQKRRRFGFVYPVLVGSGKLRQSLTNMGDGNAIAQVNATSFLVGSRLPYAAYLQSGTKRMPARPFLFIGPESRYAQSQQQGRVQRWNQILKNFVASKIAKGK